MVNMAISLDPLSARKALGKVDQEKLRRQKAALAPLMDEILPERNVYKPGGAKTPTADYSADEFE